MEAFSELVHQKWYELLYDIFLFRVVIVAAAAAAAALLGWYCLVSHNAVDLLYVVYNSLGGILCLGAIGLVQVGEGTGKGYNEFENAQCGCYQDV
jgi:hypothetical protein